MQAGSSGIYGYNPTEYRVRVLANAMAKKFECDGCGKSFDRRYHLSRHLQVCGKLKETFLCERCGRLFLQRVNYERHGEVCGRVLKCDRCGKTFSRAEYLRKHLQSCSKSRRFECERCGNAFQHRSKYIRHQASCRRPAYRRESFRCRDCESSFVSVPGLKEHMRLVSTLEV